MVDHPHIAEPQKKRIPSVFSWRWYALASITILCWFGLLRAQENYAPIHSCLTCALHVTATSNGRGNMGMHRQRGRCCPECGELLESEAGTNGEGAPPIDMQEPMTDSTYAGGDLLEPTLGSSLGYRSAEPNLIGDFFEAEAYTVTGPRLVVDVPGGGGGVRRIKLTENNSPIPRDRLIAGYNFFNNAPNGFGDVNRYTFGFEKTFRDRTMSLEARFPFAATLATDQIAGAPGSRDTEFGNMMLAWKAIAIDTGPLLISGGLGASLPTADDSRVFLGNGTPILQIDSEAFHLLPFAALLYTPDDLFFYQAFMQFDFATNGNAVSGNPVGGTLTPIGNLRDATLLFLDLTAGCWLFRDPNAAGITGVSPVLELHYSSTLESNPSLLGNGFSITPFTNRFDVLNLTVGTHFYLDEHITITPGVAFPLRSGNDHQFDCEGIVQANWYF